MPAPAPPPPGATLTLTTLIRRLFGSAFVYIRGFSTAVGGHKGIDLAAKTGTPIKAVTSGVVTYAANESLDANAPSFSRGGGNVANVDIGGGFIESYAHMSAIAVRSGQSVKPGDIIGYVGMTGGPSQYYPNIQAPTGPHLHFAVWSANTHQFVDPIPFMRTSVAMLGAWGDLVTIPVGKILTAADVDTIMGQLTAAHYFDGFGGDIARELTRRILTAHIGEAWSKALEVTLQGEFAATATAVGDNPAAQIGNALAGIAGFLATILNPANWIRILALLAGAAMTAYGAVGIMKAAA